MLLFIYDKFVDFEDCDWSDSEVWSSSCPCFGESCEGPNKPQRAFSYQDNAYQPLPYIHSLTFLSDFYQPIWFLPSHHKSGLVNVDVPPTSGRLLTVPHARQGRKAFQPRQACNECRQRKAKCDEAKPGCQHCQDLGLTCVYREMPPTRPSYQEQEDNWESISRWVTACMRSSTNFSILRWRDSILDSTDESRSAHKGELYSHVEQMWYKHYSDVAEPNISLLVLIKAYLEDSSSLPTASSLFEAWSFGATSTFSECDLGWRPNHELRYPLHEANDRHHWWPFSSRLSWLYTLPSQLRTARVQSLGGFKLLGALTMLPLAHGRPISKVESFADAMDDLIADTLRQLVSGTLSWLPPVTLLSSFLYLVRRMPPEKHLQEYRMMSAVAALGPSVLSDLRTSLPWWSLINAVSWISLVQYARVCSPGFHRSQCLLGSVVVGSVVLACTLCYASSPSQGVDSNLFGQLLGPSFWMVLVMLGLVSKRREWLRQCLQSLVDILI